MARIPHAITIMGRKVINVAATTERTETAITAAVTESMATDIIADRVVDYGR